MSHSHHCIRQAQVLLPSCRYKRAGAESLQQSSLYTTPKKSEEPLSCSTNISSIRSKMKATTVMVYCCEKYRYRSMHFCELGSDGTKVSTVPSVCDRDRDYVCRSRPVPLLISQTGNVHNGNRSRPKGCCDVAACCMLL